MSPRPGRGGSSPADAGSLVTRAHYLFSVSHSAAPTTFSWRRLCEPPGGRTGSRGAPQASAPWDPVPLLSFLERLVEQGRGEKEQEDSGRERASGGAWASESRLARRSRT